MAKTIPGKEEFHETIRYFNKKLITTGVKTKMGKKVSAGELIAGMFDVIVLATGQSISL